MLVSTVGHTCVGLIRRIAYESRASSGFKHCSDGLPLESLHGYVPPRTRLFISMASMSGPAIDRYEALYVYGVPLSSLTTTGVLVRLNVQLVVMFVVGSVIV